MGKPSVSSGQRVTYERLIMVAGELFAERGYRATTLDDVADVLQVKKASLYYYIDSKNALLRAIYDRILGRIAEKVLPIVDLDLPADERLRRMVAAHVHFVVTERSLLAVVFQEEWELPEKLRESSTAQKRQYERIFERAIREGQEAGLIREGSPRLMVLAMLGMTNWLYKWYDPSKHDERDIVGEFIQMLEGGWLASGRPTRPAWPRVDSVDDAMNGAFTLLEQARSAMRSLDVELTITKERLEQGVMTMKDGK